MYELTCLIEGRFYIWVIVNEIFVDVYYPLNENSFIWKTDFAMKQLQIVFLNGCDKSLKKSDKIFFFARRAYFKILFYYATS